MTLIHTCTLLPAATCADLLWTQSSWWGRGCGRQARADRMPAWRPDDTVPLDTSSRRQRNRFCRASQPTRRKKTVSAHTHTRTHPHTNILIELSGPEEHGTQSRSLAVFLIFRIPANLSSYPFDQTGVHDSSAMCDFCTHFPNSLSSLKFQLSMFLKKLEILAWPFFATRQYCTAHVPCTPFKKEKEKKSDQIGHAYSSNSIYFKNINKGSSHL